MTFIASLTQAENHINAAKNCLITVENSADRVHLNRANDHRNELITQRAQLLAEIDRVPYLERTAIQQQINIIDELEAEIAQLREERGRVPPLERARIEEEIIALEQLSFEDLEHELAIKEANELIDTTYPLGSLSEYYETAGKGPGTIAKNDGDIGGASYGTYQIATNTGTLKTFLNSSFFAPYADQFAGLKPGSDAFDAKWKEIADNEPEKFEKAQHDFIRSTHYDPAIEIMTNRFNFDVSSRSRALENVIWSTSVHHGGGVPPIVNAFDDIDINSLTDEQIINLIYDERGRRDPDTGELVHFSRNDRDIQESVANRFVSERADALAALQNEQDIRS